MLRYIGAYTAALSSDMAVTEMRNLVLMTTKQFPYIEKKIKSEND
jgi:hypothetical protein